MNTNGGIKARSEAKAKEEQTTKLGLDVHAGQITVCRQQEGLLAQPAQKMSWERCLGWIQEQVASGAKVYSCYEAGPCGYGLHRQLTALGVTNYVVAPQRWDERGRRVKTDKHDARELVGQGSVIFYCIFNCIPSFTQIPVLPEPDACFANLIAAPTPGSHSQLPADPVQSHRGFRLDQFGNCLLYTSPSPRDRQKYRMPSSA